MIVRRESTIINYHAPFDQGLSLCPLSKVHHIQIGSYYSILEKEA